MFNPSVECSIALLGVKRSARKTVQVALLSADSLPKQSHFHPRNSAPFSQNLFPIVTPSGIVYSLLRKSY